MNECIIGIGSNIDAGTNIGKMLEILGHDLKIIKVSTFINTSPVGITNQPDFTNGAVKIQTTLNKEELKRYLKKVEKQLGRNESEEKYGPRTMDLDIVVWNGEIVDNDYYKRDFLKKSVDEICSHL
ncbi:2-amino-4-hydroxy-6-hydroxymethyldihydropteridinepyrophosphokinase [hydrothermal vent metagenome]|uniref:2-amino-4-hydroxy-6-hydroxymethyldihydropteridine diphosphokinase n=1 Tax=hydrothermal vent metagenome TaxID=652676 RepID=A0A3B0TBW6_9ZZZZ